MAEDTIYLTASWTALANRTTMGNLAMTRFIADNFDQATEEEALSFIQLLADSKGIDLEKAIGSEKISEDFGEWFLKELHAKARKRFLSARDHIWQVVEDYLTKHGGAVSRLNQPEMLELQRAIFEMGLAHTSHMVGISVDEATAKRLKRWGWKDTEIMDFPGWAYRLALIRTLIEQNRIHNLAELLRAAMAHPISRAEQYAIELARRNALNLLTPVFDAAGRLIVGEALRREQEALRAMIISAFEKRQHPFALARDMFKLERAEGIFRDFERVARTEIASQFAQGSFRADRESGKFDDRAWLYRITRPQACKICLALFTNPDGTPTLYRVSELEQGATPQIDIGVRVPRLYRATIGSVHPNCLCAPWSKYHGEVSKRLFARFAQRYIEGRQHFGLPVAA